MKNQCVAAILAWTLALQSTSFAEVTYPLDLCQLKCEAPKYNFSCKEALRISSKEELLQVLEKWHKTLESKKTSDHLLESLQSKMELLNRSSPDTPQLISTLLKAAMDLLPEYPPLINFLDDYIRSMVVQNLLDFFSLDEKGMNEGWLEEFKAYIQTRPPLKDLYDTLIKTKIIWRLLEIRQGLWTYARENPPIATHLCHQLEERLLRPRSAHPYAHLDLEKVDYLLYWNEEITELCPQLITPEQFEALSSYRLDILREEARWPRVFMKKAKALWHSMAPFAIVIAFGAVFLGVNDFLEARERARNHPLHPGLHPVNPYAAA